MLITRRELDLHRIVISKTYEPGELDYHGANFRQEGGLTVKATAELVGSGIRICGHIGGRLQTSCDRCLAPIDIPVERGFDLFYQPVSTMVPEEEIEIPEDELDIGFYSGEGIALSDVVTEQVILSLPMKILCLEDCQGLCPVCGVNRNIEQCRCSENAGGSPFAVLKSV